MDENGGGLTSPCFICKQTREIVHTDDLGHDRCLECLLEMPTTAVAEALDFLLSTVPFSVGDRVECRTAGALLDGVGTVQQVSMSLENYGTPVYPSFLVKLEEKAHPEALDEQWYTEVCLARVDA